MKAIQLLPLGFSPYSSTSISESDSMTFFVRWLGL